MADVTHEGGQWGSADRAMRRVFGLLNRYWWLPIIRSGLGPLFGTPFGGYVMVLKATGRTSGIVRHVPLNYAIENGSVYCLAGFGPGAHWYRNIEANPRVEVILSSITFAGLAETVTDDAERIRALRRVLIGGALPGFGLGINPRTASDEALRERSAGLPLVRIRPTGIGSGPTDPGGWFWVVAQGVIGLVAARWILRRIRPSE